MAHAARLGLRLQKELKLLMSDPPTGVSFPHLSENDQASSSSLSSIEAHINGPEGTVYFGGVFIVKIQIPERYPFHPPNVTFHTRIYHPNIDDGGRVCLDILNMPPKGAWQPSLNISTVLMSIGLLMSDPNPDDGLVVEASKEYKYNRQAFERKARSWTVMYANVGASRNEDATHSVPNIDRASSMREDACRDEGNRKRLRLEMVEKRGKEEDAGNVPPTRRLSLSQTRTPHDDSIPSALQPAAPHNEAEPVVDGGMEQHAAGPQISETEIVLDSEGSDEECQIISTSRLSLRRKQLLSGKRRLE